MFTGREHARACPASGAFTYRGRQYAGSVLLAGPGWRGTATLGLSLYPAGGPAGRSTADTIAGIIAADVAAYLHDHSEILDLAVQARARTDQARAQRDLDFQAAEIVAAEHHLDELPQAGACGQSQAACQRAQARSRLPGRPRPAGQV